MASTRDTVTTDIAQAESRGDEPPARLRRTRGSEDAGRAYGRQASLRDLPRTRQASLDELDRIAQAPD